MKYPCQGPYCHTRATKDRFQKKSKRLRGRNAYHAIEHNNNSFTIFCTTHCQHDWVNANVQNILAQRPIPFNHERKLSDDTYHLSTYGWVTKDGVDNE